MTDYKVGDRVRISGWPELTAEDIEAGLTGINGAVGTVFDARNRDRYGPTKYIIVYVDGMPWPCLPEELELLDE